jgi:hypothetical protein
MRRQQSEVRELRRRRFHTLWFGVIDKKILRGGGEPTRERNISDCCSWPIMIDRPSWRRLARIIPEPMRHFLA